MPEHLADTVDSEPLNPRERSDEEVLAVIREGVSAPRAEQHFPAVSRLHILGSRMFNFVLKGGYNPATEENAAIETVEKYGLDGVGYVEECESWETAQYIRSRWG